MISQHQTAYDALAKSGIEHGAASKVTSKVHEDSVLAFPTNQHLEEY